MSLKELLGEELYNQVTEKVGDNKIAIVSDGNWIPKDKFDEKNNELKGLQGQLTELQGTLETKENELSNVDEIKQELQKYKLKNLKTSIAIKAGIPLELANRLSGETEEELKADAETLAEFVNKKPTLPLKPNEPNVNTENQEMEQMLDSLLGEK